MIDVIKKSDLESYIIHEGCDKGCGYIDERDLGSIHVFNTYTQDEVLNILAGLWFEICDQQVKEDSYISPHERSGINIVLAHCANIVQQKIDKVRGKNGEKG